MTTLKTLMPVKIYQTRRKTTAYRMILKRQNWEQKISKCSGLLLFGPFRKQFYSLQWQQPCFTVTHMYGFSVNQVISSFMRSSEIKFNSPPKLFTAKKYFQKTKCPIALVNIFLKKDTGNSLHPGKLLHSYLKPAVDRVAVLKIF